MSINSDYSQQGAGRGGVGVEETSNAVEIVEVTKAFGGGPPVLDGVSVGLREGAITTMMGPSGTGKSVLLKHVVGLLEPDDGEIRIFGDDLWEMTEEQRFELRKRFGLLFQDGALFGSMNIYDNVAFPLRKHTRMSESEIREVVMGYIQEVGLEHALDRAPNEISGGMKKRAGFARALVMKPEIVMFDEPDSGLDPVRTRLLCELILKTHQEHGGTYLVITHNIDAAQTVSDYIGVLYQGKLADYGTTDDVFNSDVPMVGQLLRAEPDGPLGME
ncbi:ATP-binding cassette domain-containing protein [Actinomycetospora endophytica]|uniref:ATP-binding cassette domain-containing protein n=1 Tax=Actinomycetospora endophytica TaxID=2291215 RepID=A0ABS8PJZ8_9PSEU|nr:ATP-binding cassette domain-containing protein [Actinomycetospora endophytica]MCD2198247.1 ATP-binding cassette domain-containing protein [Actinomycetospora endophytica]